MAAGQHAHRYVDEVRMIADNDAILDEAEDADEDALVTTTATSNYAICWHIRHIYEKLHVHSRTEAAARLSSASRWRPETAGV